MEIIKLVPKININSSDDLSAAKDIVCYNQGKLAEYMFLNQSYSFKFDEAITNFFININITNAEKIQQIMQKYKSETITFLENAINQNLKYCQDYFKNRASENARSCIKLLTKEGKIADTYRNIKNNAYPYEKNTGFYEVIKTGKPYLCNDIPYEIKHNQYKNTRINIQAAKNYKISTINKIKKLAKIDYTDQEWINCWSGYKKSNKPQKTECYKSTLIIPMTLLNNDLSTHFKINFFKDYETKEKTIIGFLCFDHIETNYFKDNDIKMGFIIADLLSLYYLIDTKMRVHDENFKSAHLLIQNIEQAKNINKFIETTRRQLEN